MKLKVVVTDPMMIRLLDFLKSTAGSGVQWFACPIDDNRVFRLLENADVYVGFRFTERMAEAAKSLRLIQVSGAGIERISLDALRPDVAASLVVANTYHHERSIAEHVIMVMLALSRRLLSAEARMREGMWDSVYLSPFVKPRQTLRDRSLGVIGYGHIGKEVIRLSQGFRMRTMAIKRNPNPESAVQNALEFLGGPKDLPTLLCNSDFVVVAIPLTHETRGMIGREQVGLMKPTANLINVSRAAIVDEVVLYEALVENRIAGAALDVWNRHPVNGQPMLPSSLPFHKLDNAILTPHNSGNTEETFTRRAQDVVENIKRLMGEQQLRNVVYPSNKTSDDT